jgi:hypothetical protein
MSSIDASTTNATTISGEKPKLQVFNVHCDPYTSPSSTDTPLTFSESENKWGVLARDVFIVLRGAEVVNSIVSQLESHMNQFVARGDTYKADSVYIQLMDSQGEAGSEMVSSNLATRLVNQLQVYRDFCAKGFVAKYPGVKFDKKSTKFAPTAAGLRLYLKLPTGNTPAETVSKVGALLEKYRGAAATLEEEKHKAVTFKINMFGCYNDKFYMNYRLISPFDTREKDEILAAPVTAKKPAAKRKVSVADDASTTNASVSAPAKKARSGSVGGSGAIKLSKQKSAKPVDPNDYETEEDLCKAYMAGGMEFGMASTLAKAHFELRELEGDEEAVDEEAEDV